MRATLLRVTAVLLSATLATAALADDSSTSTVTNVTVQTGANIGLFSIATPPGNMPGCATTKRFAFDLSNAQGQAMFATVETAMAAGHSLAVTGTGDCSVWADSESVRYVSLL